MKPRPHAWIAAAAVVSAVAGEGAARAERAIRVSGAADGPFAPAELVAALRVRVAEQGPAVVVRVTPVADDRVLVAVGDRERAVDVGARRGADAARLVALAIVDATDASDATDARADAGAARRATAREAPGPWVVSVGATGGARVWSSILAGGAVEASVARAGWVGSLALEGQRSVSGALAMTEYAIRACGGVTSGVFELRGGVVVMPTTETDGMGDRTTLVGATLGVRLRAQVGTNVALVAAAGVDAYGTQTTYVLAARTVTTPWIAPWVGFGTEVQL